VIAIDVATRCLSAGGVLVGLAVLLATKRLSLALGSALDLWTAASLARLSAEDTWRALATAATMVAVRRILSLTLGQKRRRT
jgi:hypothetical protein